MTQAGLHVPAGAGSRQPIFRSIFADIGDEQSIEANLSTFSGHIANIAAMDRALNLPSLVLLDEVGAGTDPVEGGALGMATIDHFRRRGALVIATTHYDALKSYASTTEGVGSAAFAFDQETFAPTYQLRYGAPGRSLALEIAGRLGLTRSIIDAARQNLSEREARLSEHLAKMDQDLRNLEHERRLVARERDAIGEAESKLRSREEVLRQREDTFKRRLNEELDERLREARREIDAIIDDLKRRTAALAAEAAQRVQTSVSTGDAGAARVGAREALDAVVDRLRRGTEMPVPATSAGPVASVGDRVAVGGMGLEGTVLAIHGDDAEVDMRGKRLRAKLSDLRVLAGGAGAAAPRVNVSVQLQPRSGLIVDLNVIGCSVADALTRTEKFLDEALLTEQRTLRVIHGHGTGQLRRAIAELLQNHPLVAKFESAPPDQGGGGVTVVELKD
jgi:DNA mismatch repair protein MutS2